MKKERINFTNQNYFSIPGIRKQFPVKKIHDPRGSLTKILDIVLLIPQALKLSSS